MHPDSVALLRKLTVFTLFVLALFLAYQLLHIVAIIAFAAFLTALFTPAIATFEKWKIPDFVAVMLIYFGIFVLAASVFATTLPIFATQIVALFSTISSFADKLSVDFAAGGVGALGLPDFLVPLVSLFDPASALSSFRDNAGGIAKSVASFLSTVGAKGVGAFASFGAGVVDIVLVLVFTFFFVLERHNIRSFFYRVVGEKAAGYFRSLLSFRRGSGGRCSSAFLFSPSRSSDSTPSSGFSESVWNRGSPWRS
jgi:predicted PurR-regulated permease PerM